MNSSKSFGQPSLNKDNISIINQFSANILLPLATDPWVFDQVIGSIEKEYGMQQVIKMLIYFLDREDGIIGVFSKGNDGWKTTKEMNELQHIVVAYLRKRVSAYSKCLSIIDGFAPTEDMFESRMRELIDFNDSLNRNFVLINNTDIRSNLCNKILHIKPDIWTQWLDEKMTFENAIKWSISRIFLKEKEVQDDTAPSYQEKFVWYTKLYELIKQDLSKEVSDLGNELLRKIEFYKYAPQSAKQVYEQNTFHKKNIRNHFDYTENGVVVSYSKDFGKAVFTLAYWPIDDFQKQLKIQASDKHITISSSTIDITTLCRLLGVESRNDIYLESNKNSNAPSWAESLFDTKPSELVDLVVDVIPDTSTEKNKYIAMFEDWSYTHTSTLEKPATTGEYAANDKQGTEKTEDFDYNSMF